MHAPHQLMGQRFSPNGQHQPPSGHNQQERLNRAAAFFRELQHTHMPSSTDFGKIGSLNDMQRLLQTLTNTAFIENKNHNLLTKHAASDAFAESQSQLAAGKRPSLQTHFLLCYSRRSGLFAEPAIGQGQQSVDRHHWQPAGPQHAGQHRAVEQAQSAGQ